MRSLAQDKAAGRRDSLLQPASSAVVAVCAVLFFLYSWLRVEPCLRYHHSAPVFLLAPSFFHRFVGYPGGLLEYAAAFLAQLDCASWLGALVWTGLGGLILLATHHLLRRTTGVCSPLVLLGPMFLLLWLHGRYDLPATSLATGLLAALGLGLAYAAQPWDRPWLRLAVCWAFAASLFYLAGLYPCLLLVAICVLFELRARGRRWLGLGCLLSCLMAPLGQVCLADAYRPLLPKPPGQGWTLAAVAALYLFYPLAAGVLAWHGKRAASAPSPGRVSAPAGARDGGARSERAGGQGRIIWAGALVVGWALIWLTFDGEHKRAIQISYYTEQRQWHKALAPGASIHRANAETAINLVRVLYHAGRLSEDLFSFPVATGFELLPGLSSGLECCRAQAETLFELGQVNLAEHFAHEALETEGERPQTLMLLARINVLKQRPQVARIFLSVLRQIPFQRARADTALRRLEAGREGPADLELAQIRPRLVTTDQPSHALPAEPLLRQLLLASPKNQMAFEYLMAHFLLTRQPDKLLAELGRVDDFGYSNLPRHYEEALLLCEQKQASPPVNVPGRGIRAETRRRFIQLLESLRRLDPKTPEGHQTLWRDFGNTYWFYHLSRSAAASQSELTPARP